MGNVVGICRSETCKHHEALLAVRPIDLCFFESEINAVYERIAYDDTSSS